jgi:hypothetical protein
VQCSGLLIKFSEPKVLIYMQTTCSFLTMDDTKKLQLMCQERHNATVFFFCYHSVFWKKLLVLRFNLHKQTNDVPRSTIG